MSTTPHFKFLTKGVGGGVGKRGGNNPKIKRTRDSKFHCDHTTAKYTFCSLQKTCEGQIKEEKKKKDVA